MPGTPHDSAAMLLLFESGPEDWLGELTELESAHDAYECIRKKFTGGSNAQANLDWLKEMSLGMRRGETIQQYVNRMINQK